MPKENSSGWIRSVVINRPTLQDNTADAERLIDALKAQLEIHTVDIDLSLLKRLPDLLRKWDYHVRCILLKDRERWILISITHPQDTSPIVGLAIDLGTSRLVSRFINLLQNTILAETSFDNPQLSIAPDILARIHFTDKEDGLQRLNRLLIDDLNRMINSACRSNAMEPDNIFLLSIAGNTAMTHLLMGLDPRWIIREPYIPVVNRPGILKAEELGVQANSHARVLIFPNVGSYLGGDLIAGILFSELTKKEEISILVDVGANAEVVLGNRNWLVGCAGAAGPALEGGMSQIGMMAGPGAIDKVRIDPVTREFEIHTIEDMPPMGICGSGFIDLAAHLFLSGMIDFRGKFVPSRCGGRLKKQDGLHRLVIVKAAESATGSGLFISQAEIDSLIRSKAAMYTILETMTASLDVSFKEISTFYVAGTFGSFIKPESAISIGMLPDLPIDSYQTIGNSSLGGATMALTSSGTMDEIYQIRDRVTYLELNVNQAFMNRFSAAKFLPHTDPSLFPSVSIPMSI